MRKYSYLLILAAVLLNSCMDDADWGILNDGDGIRYDTAFFGNISEHSGVFIVNEGNFMWDNASLSYYQIDSMKVRNEVFLAINGIPLGDVAQSITIRDSLAWIVINNSSKIFAMNINTFEFVGKITDLTSPRNIHFLSDTKAYVTDLYSKSIHVVNPAEFSIIGEIDIANHNASFYQHSSDRMIQFDQYVYTNCWSYDNKILVIDTENDALVDSIDVIIQPNSIVLDRYNKLWALSDGAYEGNPYGHETPGITRIDAASRKVERTLQFDLEDHPRSMCMNGSKDTLYYINKHVYRYPVSASGEPEVIIESAYNSGLSGGYYGLGIDPWSGDIYVGDALDHAQQGLVYRYKNDGTPLDTMQVGISPIAFAFKEFNAYNAYSYAE